MAFASGTNVNGVQIQAFSMGSDYTLMNGTSYRLFSVLDIICGVLIFLFCYTAFSKLAAFEKYQIDMGNQPIPEIYKQWLIYFIPLAEVVVSGLLVRTRTRLAGLFLSSCLMMMFTLYVFFVIAGVFDKRPCTCGGVIERLKWEQHFVFNLFFLVLAIIGFVLELRNRRQRNKENYLISYRDKQEAAEQTV